MVAANLAGNAVSSTSIGTPGRACARPTFRPSAVWVSIITPRRCQVSRMVATRSACVLLPDTKPNAAAGANSVGESVKPPSLVIFGPNSSAVRAPLRPSRSNTKRSKLLALLMSIDGLLVSTVSALPRTR
jgi:hypothetical protein